MLEELLRARNQNTALLHAVAANTKQIPGLQAPHC